MWRVGEKLVFGGSQSRVFEMVYRPLMSAAYWGQVWSWIQFSFVCVCIGDVWGCYQSRHRCCDLRPSSSLRHGGQVYLKFPLQRDKRMCACMCEDKEELFILPQLVCELWQWYTCTTDCCHYGETFLSLFSAAYWCIISTRSPLTLHT